MACADIPTMLRGTLRRQGYCAAWDALVQLGLTDDSYTLEGSERMTYRSFLEAFLPPAASAEQTIAERISAYIYILAGDGEVMQKLAWLGLFRGNTGGAGRGYPGAGAGEDTEGRNGRWLPATKT